MDGGLKLSNGVCETAKIEDRVNLNDRGNLQAKGNTKEVT